MQVFAFPNFFSSYSNPPPLARVCELKSRMTKFQAQTSDEHQLVDNLQDDYPLSEEMEMALLQRFKNILATRWTKNNASLLSFVLETKFFEVFMSEIKECHASSVLKLLLKLNEFPRASLLKFVFNLKLKSSRLILKRR